MRKIFAFLSVLLVYSQLTRFIGHILLSDVWYIALLFRKTYCFYYNIYAYTPVDSSMCDDLFQFNKQQHKNICSLGFNLWDTVGRSA